MDWLQSPRPSIPEGGICNEHVVGPDAGGGLVALCGLAFVVITVVGLPRWAVARPATMPRRKVTSSRNAHQNRSIAAASGCRCDSVAGDLRHRPALALWPLQSGNRRIWPILLIAAAASRQGRSSSGRSGAFQLADGADKLTAASLQGLNMLDADSWFLFNGSLGVMMIGAGACCSWAPRATGHGWIDSSRASSISSHTPTSRRF